jgi:hypothetical protein
VSTYFICKMTLYKCLFNITHFYFRNYYEMLGQGHTYLFKFEYIVIRHMGVSRLVYIYVYLFLHWLDVQKCVPVKSTYVKYFVFKAQYQE